MNCRSLTLIFYVKILLMVMIGAVADGSESFAGEAITLKAVGVPTGMLYGPSGETHLRIIDAFQKRHPDVALVPATGIEIPGKSMDSQPLMQIAGDVSPDVIYVNFRQSDTYIANKFLYPLDKYIEKTAGAEIKNSHKLSNDNYYTALSQGTKFDEEMWERMPRIVWDVIRRKCPYGEDCPYLDEWGSEQCAEHKHVWAVPQTQLVMALFYRRDIFAEAGLPDRVPETCDELLEWSRKLTNPQDNTYGLLLPVSETGWSTLSFLYSYGGRAVEFGEDGNWRCAFDSPEAVDAYLFVARLFLEPFDNANGHFECAVDTADHGASGIRRAMWFGYLDQKSFQQIDPATTGFGPVPKSPSGGHGSEYNCVMHGMYAGSVDDNKELRDIAWDYMWFFGGNEANLIRAKTFVENGQGRFVRPSLLRKAGYGDIADSVPQGWNEANETALSGGIPEPYGKNCQLVYTYMSRGIDQIRNDKSIRESICIGDYQTAKQKISQILKARVAAANEKMIGTIPPNVARFRTRVAGVVVISIIIAFIIVFRHVFKAISKTVPRSAVEKEKRKGDWRFGKNKLAYFLLLPALLSIAVWSYYPILRGTVIAFQNYNVRGFSEWVGLENFATVLFSRSFWHSMGVSFKYTFLYMLFGFGTPIILAILLSEVPKGKVFFRTIYYLPAVLSGVVVIFLWKGFYGPYGMINQLINHVRHAVNFLFGTGLADISVNWLSSPDFSLFFCLLPTIWAGMGPGCLIYLAALKTIPGDLYEAADIEGAGVIAKIRYIAIPGIRALIEINFIGAIIGAMKSGSEFILAMTGGGPYTPDGMTEVVGLHLFWEAFGYLRFGATTAMAWVLGSILVGFTVVQLKRLSKMEFKSVKR